MWYNRCSTFGEIMKRMTRQVVGDMLRTGARQTEIALYFGVSRQAVYNYVKKYALHTQKEQKYLKQVKEQKSKLLERKEAFPLGPEMYSAASVKFTRKRANCRANNIPFDLTMDDIVWHTHCPVLGMELEYLGIDSSRKENSVSFDRINPKLGYVKGNVQIISWRANRIKNDGTSEEHKMIYDYMKKYE
jgi:predicted DNA-binding protein YlxM (UPF0122 family)